MMSGYFLEYATYVIKERAIPHIDDGLKPVQRRILWTMHTMDDGKLHKVANVVGNTMSYHPHGDSSIYEALVNVANKEFFIERQGNFGNLYTGDPSSAARYIECRLSELAREVLFNRELTEFVETYDSRKQEPVSLPCKVPVLLMQGTEGIAVGMSTKIMPHNFNELLNAQINILRKETFTVYPDFFQAGTMDVSEYEDGMGKVRLRAKIEELNEKTLVITEIPASTTTESLMKTVEDAAAKGKIKISSISDYTAEKVEIEIKLQRGVYAKETIKALYAYTDCEISISCNCLLIKDGMPELMTVTEILKHNTFKLKDDLEKELRLDLAKQEDLYHFKTLAQIFIENRIYKRIEECKNADDIRSEVRKGLEPFLKQLLLPKKLRDIKDEKTPKREITDDDIEKLLQIPIRRISLFDINKNKEELKEIIDKATDVLKDLKSLTRYTIRYIKTLLKTYGKDHPRRTQISKIEEVDVRKIAQKNLKVCYDKASGHIGSSIKGDDPMQCTEFDRLVIIQRNGNLKVIPVTEREYIGPVKGVYKANKDHIFSITYKDKKSKASYAKRFQVNAYIMNKDYPIVPKGCRIDKIFDRYGVILRCELKPAAKQRIKHVDLKFDEIEIRKVTARGFKIHATEIVKYIQIKRGTDPNTGVE
ncbi:MAG: DNA topoisomerase IV subunit A [Lentisphaeria bacterium]|nr:DNA topoisomerase IV subunit A [Lentisphaeria bacterium]